MTIVGVMVVVVCSTAMVVVMTVGAVSVDTSVDVMVVVSMMLCAAASPAKRVMRDEERIMVVWFRMLGGECFQGFVGGKCSLGMGYCGRGGGARVQGQRWNKLRGECASNKAHSVARLLPLTGRPVALREGPELIAVIWTESGNLHMPSALLSPGMACLVLREHVPEEKRGHYLTIRPSG
ncbi:hypothetical protein F5144DRAFT_581154 [Chaetomium tenue]|uniref:Uncharacterized protein n=1 Tax=Chaetomium tenue TaxID=1854479 RepID=A0ACB7P041_9PEZI|nr:hypothetical protein F5144DRAFT_581154 [Chaetomium globosum]